MSFTLEAVGMICALGSDLETIRDRLLSGSTDHLVPTKLITTGRQVPTGSVTETLPELPQSLAVYQCRNHRLAYAAYLKLAPAIESAKARYSPERIGVVLGSSTAGLDATEVAYAVWLETGEVPPGYEYRKQHVMGSVARFVAKISGVGGPAYTVSTACTSGAKALISARDLLETGICDAVITGGVDTLCHMTLNGFEALGALSEKPANPMSRNRDGLNIGEGAAFFVMTREPGPLLFAGAAETCDAYHMSAPHPEGTGAQAAMTGALADAGLKPEHIAYLNLHGTATRQNDIMEAKAVQRVFGDVPCSSSKPMSGHCLGAAGAVEAAFCWLALGGNGGPVDLLPHGWDGQQDEEIPSLNLVGSSQSFDPDGSTYFMSTNFAFGGNNCAVILQRTGGRS